MTNDITLKDLKELLFGLIQSQKETDAKFKETDTKFKETDAKFKETDQKIKEAFQLFTTQWGKLMESLVEGDLVNILQSRGFDVVDTVQNVKGQVKGRNYEYDIIAHNGNEIVVVEVKTTLRVKHVKRFINNLEIIKEQMPRYKGYRVIGAIAYLSEQEEAAKFALNQHLIVIRATGNSAAIMNPIGFKPRIF